MVIALVPSGRFVREKDRLPEMYGPFEMRKDGHRRC